MLFNSYIFILLFLPLCVDGFYTLERDWRHERDLPYRAGRAKLWLVAFSLWFYGYFDLGYLAIMLCSIGFNYLICRLLYRARDLRSAGEGERVFSCRPLVGVGVTGNLALLFYFKYYDFFVENVNALFGSHLALRHVLLPLGISFFTFQQIGFLVDVYRGEADLTEGGRAPGLLEYMLFVSFFPQLVAGPIVSFREMAPQFRRIGRRTFSWETFLSGIVLFGLGLGKKVLLADTFGQAVDYGYGNIPSLNGTDAALVILFYALQLYFDFSGYCDMARGVGKMLGFELPINFESPYRSANLVEFWKRWHMTLNRFLTRYVYIPLGGSRRGEGRMYLNLLLVFLISGLWHGAGWNFIVWGLLHGALYALTKLWQRRRGAGIAAGENSLSRTGRAMRAAGTAATFLFVCCAWVFFRAERLGEAFSLFERLVSGGIGLPSASLCSVFNLKEFWYVIKLLHLDLLPGSTSYLCAVFTLVSLGIVFLLPNAGQLAQRFRPRVLNMVALALLYVWCILSLSGVSTFLYFNF